MKLFCSAVLLSLASVHCSAQEAVEAKTYLKECIYSATGGKAIKSASYHTDEFQYQYAQSYSPDRLTAIIFNNNIVVDFEHGMFNAEVFNAFPGGSEFNIRRIGANDSLLYVVDLLGNNIGESILQGTAAGRKAAIRTFHPSFQSLILQNLLNENSSLQLIKVDSVSKRGQTLLRSTSSKNLVSDYYFNNTTRLLEKVVTVHEDFYTGKSLQETNYQNYKRTDGIAISQLVTTYRNKILYSVLHVSALEINKALPGSFFNPPVGMIITPKDIPPSEQLEEVAKDIYVIARMSSASSPLPLSISFVNMDDYVVVLEAPNDNDFTQRVIKKIKEVIPTKPIKYVFVTHYHNDHAGGLRQYVAEGATLVMAEGTRKAIEGLMRRQIDDDFSKSGKNATFETYRGKKILRDAHHLIQFYEVPDSHADGDSFVYFPNEKVIYQGDHLIAPRDGTIPPMNRLTKDFIDYLEKNNIEVDRIIGTHGSTNFTKLQIHQMRNLRKK